MAKWSLNRLHSHTALENKVDNHQNLPISYFLGKKSCYKRYIIPKDDGKCGPDIKCLQITCYIAHLF